MNFTRRSARMALKPEMGCSRHVIRDESDLSPCGIGSTAYPARSVLVCKRVQISNRHFLLRLETSATIRKQTREVVSNRNISEGARTFSYRLIQIQGRTQNADSEMRQMRSVVVELDPTNHAVFLQILRDLCFADSQMFGELRLQSAVCDGPALAPSFGRAAPRSSRQIPKSLPQRLAGFHVIGRNLIRIGEQENTGSGGSRIRIIQLVQRTGHQPPQHGIEFRHPRS